MTNSEQAIRENFPGGKIAFGLSFEEAEICELSKLSGWVSRKKVSIAKAWESMVCLGNNEQFRLAGLLWDGMGRDEQSLGPEVDNEAGKSVKNQLLAELLELETISSLYPHRSRNTVDALKCCSGLSHHHLSSEFLKRCFTGPLLAFLHLCSLLSSVTRVISHLYSPISYFSPCSQWSLASLFFPEHARHAPALGLLHWLVLPLPGELLPQVAI